MPNKYWRVTHPFTVEAIVGHEKSNTYIGASMVLQTRYQTITLRPGDEIHELCGGDFAIHERSVWEFSTRRNEAWEILLHPAPRPPALPYEKLQAIDKAEATLADYNDARAHRRTK
jgi:hypothetical protein